MSSNYKSLLAQREALEKQITEARNQERGQAVEKIQELMRDYDISLAELAGKKTRKYTKRTVPPKYRDPISGKTWTGRGKPPMWIAGQNRDQFLITH
ncbi:H-NS histone family protein [Burkholderia cepacia]|uniref:H-NS histone family protein n=1 Tax=Burkholderia cepacia TaxID=292 RepID=A0AAX2RD55_BURCE|nr:H-NS histone family protein [Burkholderia cepacia]TES63850.1 H-NS histone family protein [Burkholderia cepacia]TES96732.1 H-NS histone family protein [Burkholderia cepacia]TEU34420.1 H-NS histone family protein [Burkholderia cepacia]TEU38530.1 H-NS histone family protein [Burkholderia cepacia]TEU87167.1 H-NS histone family protein [Burkholderia cepacia]